MIVRLKKNYPWIIALIVFLEMIIYGGILNASGVFTIPMAEGLHVSRGELSLAMIPRNLVGFFFTMVTGALLHHFGYRKLIVFSLSLTGISYITMALSQDLTVVALSSILFGVGSGVCGAAGAALIIKNWFRKHQGLILGIVSMATGLGGSLLSIWLTNIIVNSSWQYAYGFCALLVFLVAALCLLLRNRPEDMGLTPYGIDHAPKKTQKAKHIDSEFPGHTTKKLLRMPQFYLMLICTLLVSTCMYLSLNVTVPHFQDGGYSPEKAALFQSVLMLCLSGSKLIFGWLCDRIGAKRVTLLCVALAAVGQWILATPSGEVLTYVGIVLFSLGLPLVTIIIPLLTMSLFGYRAYGTTTGVFLAMVSLGNMISAPIANLFHDALGNYISVYQGSAILNVVSIGLYLLLFAMCNREKTRQLNAMAQLH